MIKKQNKIICCQQENKTRRKRITLTLVKGKVRKTIIISDKVYFRAWNITKDKNSYLVMIKGSNFLKGYASFNALTERSLQL